MLTISNVYHIYFVLCCVGVEFGARMINIDGKQIKLQIWDTVSGILNCIYTSLLNQPPPSPTTPHTYTATHTRREPFQTSCFPCEPTKYIGEPLTHTQLGYSFIRIHPTLYLGMCLVSNAVRVVSPIRRVCAKTSVTSGNPSCVRLRHCSSGTCQACYCR